MRCGSFNLAPSHSPSLFFALSNCTPLAACVVELESPEGARGLEHCRQGVQEGSRQGEREAEELLRERDA